MIEPRTITAEDYLSDPDARAYADRLLAGLEIDPTFVTRLSVTASRVTVFVIDRRSGTSTIRETHYDLPRER